MPDLSLEGKVALVTGAGIRLGRAIALRLARAGADVAVHHRTSGRDAEDVAAAIRALGRRAATLRADIEDPAACAALAERSIAALGGLDLLVHSAANFHRAPLADTTAALWDSAMNVNARSGLLLVRAAETSLRERKGRVVFISDAIATQPARGYAAHAASKAAVEGLVRALALELAPEVSVNGVSPGTVLVPEGTSPEDAARWARSVPAKRNGSPEDVADTVLFFCAGPAFITGQVLGVDGGKSLV
jgi:NAD(P)-dependent dehydrogenase (short-subunit alcohol dehydrogenase family)